ncbi:MAG: hypothetical protein ABUK06_05205 [Dehalococcoidales bacterium]
MGVSRTTVRRHLARGGGDDLWGFVVANPDAEGVWRTCSLRLAKND